MHITGVYQCPHCDHSFGLSDDSDGQAICPYCEREVVVAVLPGTAISNSPRHSVGPDLALPEFQADELNGWKSTVIGLKMIFWVTLLIPLLNGVYLGMALWSAAPGFRSGRAGYGVMALGCVSLVLALIGLVGIAQCATVPDSKSKRCLAKSFISVMFLLGIVGLYFFPAAEGKPLPTPNFFWLAAVAVPAISAMSFWMLFYASLGERLGDASLTVQAQGYFFAWIALSGISLFANYLLATSHPVSRSVAATASIVEYVAGLLLNIWLACIVQRAYVGIERSLHSSATRHSPTAA